MVGGDDTLVHKTGKQVYNVGYLRDPLSRKFRHHLVLGLRYIQLSLLLPLYRISPDEVRNACALPIRFALAWSARRLLKYKEVRDIVWPGGAETRVLRLIVIAATPYRRRKHANLSYRQPGYLLTTERTTARLVRGVVSSVV